MTELRRWIIGGVFILLVIVLPTGQTSRPSASSQRMASPLALSWSSPILIDTNQGADILPNALQASNGTLWLAWQSDRYGQYAGRYDILYETYTNGIWSSFHNITSSGYNASPSLVQLPNSTILIFYASKIGNSFAIKLRSFNSGGWSNPFQVSFPPINDTLPSAAVGKDGTLWLVWTRMNNTCSSCTTTQSLYYRTMKNGVWSAETQLTNDSSQQYDPSTVVAKDGLVRVVYANGTGSTIYQIYSKSFNGSTWTRGRQVVTSSSTDDRPSLVQDRNGTLWLFWGRLIVLSPTTQYYVIMSQYSYDLGQTWLGQTQLTNTSTSYDSWMPSAVQSTYGVKPILVFYSSNLNVPNYSLYADMSTGVNSVHDVVVSTFAVSNNLGVPWIYPGGFRAVGQGPTETVVVTVRNIGDFVENVTLTVSAAGTTNATIGVQRNRVGPGNSWTFYYYWNTTGVSPSRYGLSAAVAPLPGETIGNMGDNNAVVSNMIHVLPFGDIDQDGSVTITDVSQFFYDYGFTSSCGCSRYNPYADINNDGAIDIVDVGVVLANYNTFT